MKDLKDLISELDGIDNNYLDKKEVIKRLKKIVKNNTGIGQGIGIPYNAMSNSFKNSIDSIEDALNKD